MPPRPLTCSRRAALLDCRARYGALTGSCDALFASLYTSSACFCIRPVRGSLLAAAGAHTWWLRCIGSGFYSYACRRPVEKMPRTLLECCGWRGWHRVLCPHRPDVQLPRSGSVPGRTAVHYRTTTAGATSMAADSALLIRAAAVLQTLSRGNVFLARNWWLSRCLPLLDRRGVGGQPGHRVSVAG